MRVAGSRHGGVRPGARRALAGYFRLLSRTAGTQRRSPVVRRLVLAALLLGAASGALLLLPNFRVNSVEVRGISAISAEEVVKVSDVGGKNIFLLDTAEAEGLVERLRFVKEARISRVLPSGVVIEIAERAPAAVWQARGKRFVIDKEGVILGNDTGEMPLPTIVSDGDEPLALGGRVEARAVGFALELAQLLPKRLGTKALEFKYSAASGLRVRTDRDLEISFDPATEVAFQVATLEEIVKLAEREGLAPRVIDLRFGYRPYFKAT